MAEISAPLEFLEKMAMLERSVLELGTEVYTLRNTVNKSKDSHEQFFAVIKGLKQLLDEKGLITLDDFEAAVELGQAIESFNRSTDDGHMTEMDRLKKSNH